MKVLVWGRLLRTRIQIADMGFLQITLTLLVFKRTSVRSTPAQPIAANHRARWRRCICAFDSVSRPRPSPLTCADGSQS